MHNYNQNRKERLPSNHSSNAIKLSDNSSHLDTPVKNCVSEIVPNKSETDMEVDMQEVSTKTDLKPVEKISNLSNSDNCIKSEHSTDKKNEPIPMEIDSEPKTDTETNSSESVVKDDSKLLSSTLVTHEKIQAESNKSLCNNTVTPAESLDQESKFKVGKIKLYEKWSNEKKKLAAAQSECSLVSSDSLPSNKEHVDPERSVAVNPEVDVLCNVSEKSNLLKHNDGFPSNIDQSSCNDEVPMDLSITCRTSDGIKQNASVTNNHSITVPLPIDSKNSLFSDSKRSDSRRNIHSESAIENPLSDKCSNVENSSMNINPQVPRPFKKKHLSMVKDDSIKGNYEHARKSVIFEVKNSKLLNQYVDIPYNHDDRPSQVSGFSHLQALQNMCDNNPMAGLQNSVIQSITHDKKSKLDSNSCKKINANEKPSFSGTCFDNLSKYNFSGAQVSTDIKSAAECEVTDTLLKSNVNCSPVSSQKDKHEMSVPELNCESICTKSEITNQNCETDTKNKIDMLKQKEQNSVKKDIKSNSQCSENVSKVPVEAVDSTEYAKKSSEESIKMKKIQPTVLDADDSTHSVVQNDKSCSNAEVRSDGKEKELMGSFDKNANQVEVSASKITECCTLKVESSENTENSVGGNNKQEDKKYLVTGREEGQEIKPVDSSEQTSKKIKLTDEEPEEPLKSSDIGEQSARKITDKQLTSSEEVLENKNLSVPKDEIKMCVISPDNDIVRNDSDIKKSSDELDKSLKADKCASTKSQENIDSSVSSSSTASFETGIKSVEDNSKCSEMDSYCPESEVSNSNPICQNTVKNGISESHNLNNSDRESEKCAEEVSLKNEKSSTSINSESETAAISLNNICEEKKEVCKESKVSDLNCFSVEKHESAAVISEHISVLPEQNSASSSRDTSDISESNGLLNVTKEKLSAKAADEACKSKCDNADAEKINLWQRIMIYWQILTRTSQAKEGISVRL
ncbi:intracellular protein transport protein USO1-like [Stegodyphus dumicola]|uniref:intracellular protein transport protein USO1-like n=1 Tax=Stegodyphus dumicola TaxID=202533 RepID=UPI0015B0E344|nr:intracellular protein transport protein USO1-like [Stegodyphus dumicola]